MVGQRLATVLAGRFVLFGFGGRLGLRFGSLGNLLVFLEGQIELVEALRLRAEPVPLVACKLMLELLHLQGERLHLVGQNTVDRSQFGGVFRRYVEVLQHPRSSTGPGPQGES